MEESQASPPPPTRAEPPLSLEERMAVLERKFDVLVRMSFDTFNRTQQHGKMIGGVLHGLIAVNTFGHDLEHALKNLDGNMSAATEIIHGARPQVRDDHDSKPSAVRGPE